MKNMKQWPIITFVLIVLAWHYAQPINLARIDLGRHIKNGELIVKGTWDVLYKNYYSYTYPEQPFVNHHWFFGVFCYSIWHFVSFAGLSLVYILLELLTFYLFFRRAKDLSSFWLACAFGLLSIPLLALRIQIRPEGFSMLFCGLFWLLLASHQEGRLKANHLKIILALLQILWVNSHLFFIMGPILIGLFWLQAKADSRRELANTFKQTF